VKLEFFNRSAGDQAAIIREVAARRGISAVMVEKTSGFRGHSPFCLLIQNLVKKFFCLSVLEWFE
jgi:hypothetical protein